MRTIVVPLGLFFSLFINVTLLDAVIVKLPYPDVCKHCFASDQDQEIILRNSMSDTQTMSSECPYSKVLFDELFDESGGNKIVVGGLVCEINYALTTHYFDALSLMNYLMELLPEKSSRLTFSDDAYCLLKNSYKNAVDGDDHQVYEFVPGSSMSDREREWYYPIFINPVNRQKILTVHFFKISREHNSSGFSYAAHYLGDMDQMLLNDATHTYFNDTLSHNIFWRDKIVQSIQIIKDILLYHKDYVEAEKEYIRIDPIITLKKDDIAQDEELSGVLKSKLYRWFEEFAIFFYDQKEYSKSLFYSEKNVDCMDALARAGKIRLGYMKNAPLKEQLKGLDAYQKLLERIGPGVRKDFYSLELAQLLYDRAQNDEDANTAISCIQEISDSKMNKNYLEDDFLLWVRTHLLMGKIYFRQKNYDRSEYYWKKVEKIKSPHYFSGNSVALLRSEAEWLLLKSAWLQEKESTRSFIQSFLHVYDSVDSMNFRLKADIAGNIASVLIQKYENKTVKNDKIAKVIDFLTQSKMNYENYLQKYTDLNDYERSREEDHLKFVNTQLLSLQEKQTISLSVQIAGAKKRESDYQGDTSLKRRKK